MSDLDREKPRDVRMEESRLITKVFAANQNDKRKRSDEIVVVSSENFEHVVEVEHRCLPSAEDGILDDKGNLDPALILKDDAVFVRRIEQAYVDARIPGSKATERFRLRKTTKYDNKGTLLAQEYRIALKNHLEDNPNARVETQVIIDLNDPDKANERLEFETLWKGREVYSFDRYYVKHQLPIPDEYYESRKLPVPSPEERWCELHIERRHPPPAALKNMVRIEIEYQRTADERFVAENKEISLPKWVGPDVTADAAYTSKNLVKNGPPKSYRKHMEGIQEERKARAKSRRRQEEKQKKKLEKQRRKEEKKKKKRKGKVS